jgi:hypothetical protein
MRQTHVAGERLFVAVSMNFGPLVLMDFGPPPEFNLLRRA